MVWCARRQCDFVSNRLCHADRADFFQIGLLAAGPAVINLMFTLPTGHWLESRPIGPAVFWSWNFTVFYLIWVVIPWLLLPHVQLWLYIVITR